MVIIAFGVASDHAPDCRNVWPVEGQQLPCVEWNGLRLGKLTTTTPVNPAILPYLYYT